MKHLLLCIPLLSLAGCAPSAQLKEIARQVVVTPDAPKPVGPYVQGVKVGDTVYCSGQIAIDPTTGELVSGNIRAETRQVLNNLREVLKAAGMSFDDVVKATVYVEEMTTYGLVNEVYAEYFSGSKPAREVVGVAALPKKAHVEISLIAIRRSPELRNVSLAQP
jgi:2-iminobutanoate/2-iminopropanoate deaminase